MLSVHHDLNATLRIFGRSVLPSKLRSARSEKFQSSKVSIEKGQACDPFLGEGSSHVRTVGLEQWHLFGGDDQSFLGSPDLKLYIDTGRLVGIHGNAAGYRNFESNGFRPNVILAGDQVGDTVVAALVGGRLKLGAFLSSCNRQVRASDRGTRLVRDRAEDAAVDSLSEGRRRHQGIPGQKHQHYACRWG